MKRRPLWPLLPPAAVLLAAAVMLSVIHLAGASSGCGFHRLTGLHCPGCGGTRCGHALLRGDLRSALSHNALVFTGLVLFLSGSGYLIVRMTILGKPAPRIPEIGVRWLWVAFAGVVAFAILRNIPAWPFKLLAP